MQEEATRLQGSRAVVPVWKTAQNRAWRNGGADVSLWQTVLAQIAVLAVVVGVAVLLSARREIVASMLWGGLAACLPSAFCIAGYRTTMRLLANKAQPVRAMLGLVSIAFWEAIKLVLSIGLLVLAPRWLLHVHWLSVVLMFVVILKTYWLAVLLNTRAKAAG